MRLGFIPKKCLPAGKAGKCIFWEYGIIFLTAATIFIIDFFIKSYIRTQVTSSIPLIKNVLQITPVLNSGAAFGVLQGRTVFLTYIGIIFILVFMAVALKERRRDLLFLISSGLILGGALSNLYDRIFLKYVVDYIDIRVWPVFNLSDSCISIGVFLLFIDSFKKNAKATNCSS
jgi:signal peptidase II